MPEKTDRNKRLYLYHLRFPKISYAKLGKIFTHKDKNSSKTVPINASAIYRIIKREQCRESKPREK